MSAQVVAVVVAVAGWALVAVRVFRRLEGCWKTSHRGWTKALEREGEALERCRAAHERAQAYLDLLAILREAYGCATPTPASVAKIDEFIAAMQDVNARFAPKADEKTAEDGK
jgi:hypothetical protein